MSKVIGKARHWWNGTPDGRIAEVFLGSGAAFTLLAGLAWVTLGH